VKNKQGLTNDILFTTKVTLLVIYYLHQGDIADWMPLFYSILVLDPKMNSWK